MTDLPDFREIEVADLASLICRLEERHHARGWRKSLMTVYVIFDRHRHRQEADIIAKVMGSLGPAIVVGRYGAQPMIVDRMLADTAVPPWKALSAFAHNLAFIDTALLLASEDVENAEHLADGLRKMRDLLRLPGIIAFAACYEGYGLEEISPALLDVVAGAEEIETAPGAREGRMLLMVDAGDHVHKVHRVRGHDHVVEMFAGMRGDTTTSLRKLMDLAMDRLPKTQAEADARYEGFEPGVGGAAFQGRQHQPAG